MTYNARLCCKNWPRNTRKKVVITIEVNMSTTLTRNVIKLFLEWNFY